MTLAEAVQTWEEWEKERAFDIDHRILSRDEVAALETLLAAARTELQQDQTRME